MAGILLLGPDQALSVIIERYLQRAGHDVRVVHQSQEALTTIDQHRPGIVVMELAIPGANGLAFLQEFRSYTDWQNIPAIIYTQVPQSDTGLDDTGWQKYGVQHYCYKPTTSLAALNRFLGAYEIS